MSKTLKRTVRLALLAAISIILVYFIRIPLVLPFLEYDPADIPILIGAMMYGPVWGIILTVIVSVIQGLTVSSLSGLYGIIMHIIATGTLVLVSTIIYQRKKTKKRAVIGLIAGAFSMILIMIPCNLIITPLFTGFPIQAIIDLLPGIILFNVIKAGINSVVTFLLYKRISGLLDPDNHSLAAAVK